MLPVTKLTSTPDHALRTRRLATATRNTRFALTASSEDIANPIHRDQDRGRVNLLKELQGSSCIEGARCSNRAQEQALLCRNLWVT